MVITAAVRVAVNRVLCQLLISTLYNMHALFIHLANGYKCYCFNQQMLLSALVPEILKGKNASVNLYVNFISELGQGQV